MYVAASALRLYRGPEEIIRALQQDLQRTGYADVHPWLDLGASQQRWRQMDDLGRTVEAILERHPDHPRALEFQAFIHSQQGDVETAIALQQRSVQGNPLLPDSHYNLGLYLNGKERRREALAALGKAVALRPIFPMAWYYLGYVHRLLDEPELAVDAYRRCLAIDPGHSRAYVELAELLAERGESGEGLRYLRHGAKSARRPELLEDALASAEAAATDR